MLLSPTTTAGVFSKLSESFVASGLFSPKFKPKGCPDANQISFYVDQQIKGIQPKVIVIGMNNINCTGQLTDIRPTVLFLFLERRRAQLFVILYNNIMLYLNSNIFSIFEHLELSKHYLNPTIGFFLHI